MSTGILCPSTSALAVQLTENWLFGEVVSDSGEVSTYISSGSNERVTEGHDGWKER